MEYLANILRQYPAIALFLTLGLGFLLGKIRFKNFSLGSVTSVLLMGVLIGQLDIPISDQIKSIFFMLFLFSIGYSVGPQFFRSLKGMGLKQVLFAVLMSSTCFAVTLAISKIMHYNAGETVGLFSGSQTCSALLGVGTDSINNHPGDPAVKQAMINIIPVCYAVTYIFGTLGTVIILGNLGPRLLGGLEKVKEQTRRYEDEVESSGWVNDPVNVSALRQVAFRALRVDNPFFEGGKTVSAAEDYYRANGKVVYIDRVRRLDGTIAVAHPDMVIYPGETVVVCGRRQYILDEPLLTGPEVDDDQLLHYPVERIPVKVSARRLADKTVGQLRAEKYMRGVMIEGIARNGKTVPVEDDTKLTKQDTVTLVGRRGNLRKAALQIGYMDVPTSTTDLMFVGLAIFIGGIIGTLSIVVDSIPISFGTSGGSLVAGLVFGWLRTRRPTFGRIPPAALQLMNQLGLNVFVGVVGLTAAPSFVLGLKTVGGWLLLVGAIGTTIPLLVGILLGRYVFKFNPAITLGCCAGTRTCTAALGAVQDAIGSTLPAMGYTVTYAVSNILLVIWGIVTVLLC